MNCAEEADFLMFVPLQTLSHVVIVLFNNLENKALLISMLTDLL